MWDKLLGCFGDGLLRKFGAEPPEEWVLAVGGLDPRQVTRGLRRILYGWRGGPPNLPDFLRLCRTIGDELDEGQSETPRIAADDGWRGDKWDLEANRHLLAHIMRERGKFTVEQTTALVRAKNLWAADMRDIASNGEVPPDTQRAIWSDYIGRVA